MGMQKSKKGEILEMTVCFIGLGYIGLPTAIISAKNGLKVVGCDINEKIVDATNAGILHFKEPGLAALLREVVADKRLTATTKPQVSDVYVVVVPTPFKEGHQPDISYVQSATESVIPILKQGDLFVIESTSPVGTTDKMANLIYANRPELKGQISIAYCPERVIPGNVVFELEHNDRVIGGVDDASTQKAMEFYSHFVKGALHKTNAKTAEMCKLTENSSRDVQIAFANELSIICDKEGIDVRELIRLANKHPRVNILQPGCGVGGHCIAVDPYFITSAFKSESKLIATAREVNNYKEKWCVEKLKNAILTFKNEHQRLPKLAVMGLSFKPNIDDLRESPAKFIANEMIAEMPADCVMIVEPNLSEYGNVKLWNYEEAYEKADIVAFLVAHDQFKTLKEMTGKIIIDFCGIKK